MPLAAGPYREQGDGVSDAKVCTENWPRTSSRLMHVWVPRLRSSVTMARTHSPGLGPAQDGCVHNSHKIARSAPLVLSSDSWSACSRPLGHLCRLCLSCSLRRSVLLQVGQRGTILLRQLSCCWCSHIRPCDSQGVPCCSLSCGVSYLLGCWWRCRLCSSSRCCRLGQPSVKGGGCGPFGQLPHLRQPLQACAPGRAGEQQELSGQRTSMVA